MWRIVCHEGLEGNEDNTKADLNTKGLPPEAQHEKRQFKRKTAKLA
jgi:hypothetical protein